MLIDHLRAVTDRGADAPDPLRRQLLAAGSATLFGSVFWPAARAAVSTSSDDVIEWSATDAVRRMTQGDCTAEYYATQLLAQCERYRSFNAFITLDPARVLEQARQADRWRHRGGRLGPLHGLPIPVKDSINTAEYPTSAGTPGLTGFRPQVDADIVARLRSAGAVVLGKTNLHELSYGWTSRNETFGAVQNPYDPSRIPGGSSGGTAAAVAARMAPLGVAEDTEGSIRVPAALCGLVGLRPSTGRYSTAGAIPCSPRFDQVGPHARSVDDLVLFDGVATGDYRPLNGSPLQGVRLALGRRYFWGSLDPEVERLCQAAVQLLVGAGVVIVEAEVEGIEQLAPGTTDTIVAYEMRRSLDAYLTRWHAPVNALEVIARASPELRPLLQRDLFPQSPGYPSRALYQDALQRRLPALRRAFSVYFAATGAVAHVFPTTLVPAPRIGEETTVRIGDRALSFDEAIGRNITPGSTAGLPGLVLPIGLTAGGLPVALEFDAPAGHDRALLSLGLALEQVLGQGPRPPTL